MRRTSLWCSPQRNSHPSRRGSCPWPRLPLWATTSPSVARTSFSAAPTPPLSHSLLRYTQTMLFTRDYRAYIIQLLSGCCVCGCWCVFPGERSGFGDCQSYRPVQTPKQLPGCWHHRRLCSELVSVWRRLTNVKYQSEMSLFPPTSHPQTRQQQMGPTCCGLSLMSCLH